MEPIKKILVAIDFSPITSTILEYARFFAKQCSARVILVHSVPSLDQIPTEYLPHENLNTFITDTLSSTKKNLEELATTYLHDIPTDIQIPMGEAVGSILEIVNNQQCDLIIIGATSKNTLEKIFLGSVAEKLASISPKSVVIVR
ncbi:MAG: universal stress protein [Desulfovibrionaceae bacterium]